MKQKIRIITIIIFSFLAVKLLVPQVFLANTPKVNPMFIVKLQNTPTYIASIPGNIISLLKNTSNNNQIANKDKNSTSSTGLIPVNPVEAAAVLDNLTNVTPPAKAKFTPLSTGVSTYMDSTTNKTILKVDKGTKYSVERYQLSNGEIKDVIIFE